MSIRRWRQVVVTDEDEVHTDDDGTQTVGCEQEEFAVIKLQPAGVKALLNEHRTHTRP